MGISVRAYGIRRGVSQTAVQKAIASGRITQEQDGTIDPEKADIEWEKNTSPGQMAAEISRRGIPGPKPKIINEPPNQSQNNVPNYQTSRAIRETYNAKIARLDYEERIGKLVNADEIASEAFSLARRVRDRILGVPRRLSATLAAETDIKVIEQIMEKELRTALEELAQ